MLVSYSLLMSCPPAIRLLRDIEAARVSIIAIHPPEELDVRRVGRLKEIFRKGGCRPEHIVNHVLLLIDQSSLERGQIGGQRRPSAVKKQPAIGLKPRICIFSD